MLLLDGVSVISLEHHSEGVKNMNMTPFLWLFLLLFEYWKVLFLFLCDIWRRTKHRVAIGNPPEGKEASPSQGRVVDDLEFPPPSPSGPRPRAPHLLLQLFSGINQC